MPKLNQNLAKFPLVFNLFIKIKTYSILLLMGRPSTYNAELHVPMAKSLYRIGLTDIEVAEEFGVSVNTILKWANQYADFKRARKEGKAHPDSQVVAALFKKAVGYEYTEELKELKAPKYPVDKETGKIMRPRGRPPKPKLVTTRITVKQSPPDTLAMIYWLKNRMPELYKDRHQVEINGGGVATILVPTNDQVDRLIEAKLKAAQITDGNGAGGNGHGGNGSGEVKDVTGSGDDG